MVRSVFLFVLFSFASLSSAQEYPSKSVRILVPVGAGSGPDAIMRAISPHMSALLGQSVIVENRVGGGGVQAIMELKNSAPDGYTLLTPDSSQWAIYPAVRSNAPFDPLRDFAPIGMIYSSNFIFYVPASSPIQNLRELIAEARANPGKLRYGVAPGLAGVMQLAGEALSSEAGLKLVVVPYPRSADALLAVLRGDLEFALGGYQSTVSQARAGKIRHLAVTTDTREPDAPGLPTVAEAGGIPGYNIGAEFGLVGRGGTPQPVIQKISAALNKSMAHPDVIQASRRLDFNLVTMSPERFDEFIKDGVKKYAQIVKAANIKLE